MKKAFSLLFCLLLALTVFTACKEEQEPHKHTFATEWTQDETHHWHVASCEHTNEVSDKGEHKDDDNNDVCDICGYVADHTHTYEDTWTQGKETHYKKATCKHDVKKEEAAHVDANNDALCDVCQYNYDHEHTYADGVWTVADDEGSHWRAPTCGHNVPGVDKAAHVDADKDGVCDICKNQGELLNFKVTFKKPENVAIVITSADGTEITELTVKQGTDTTFKVTMPVYAVITKVNGGATIEGEPVKVKDTDNHTYTLKISKPTADMELSFEIQKNSSVDIVAQGEVEMTIESAWSDVTGTLKVNVPGPGKYVIYSLTHPGAMMGVGFELAGNELIQDSTAISYAFEATEAGELEFAWKYFAMELPEGGKETFEYTVAKYDDEKVLDTLVGGGYLMPTNASIKVTFTVDKPGLWIFNSSSELSWDGVVSKSLVFQVEEGELTKTLTMHYNTEAVTSFIFDWEIVPMEGGEPIEVEMGENELTAPFSNYQTIIFTPSAIGSYHFSFSEAGMELYHWSELMAPLGFSYVLDVMTEEDIKPYTFYVAVNNSYDEELTEDITGKLLIANNVQSVYDQDDNFLGYNALIGVPNVYDAYGAGKDYTITLPDGTSISFDEGTTWESGTIQTTSPENGLILFWVKSDDTAATNVMIEEIVRIAYTGELTVGENTLTLIPGKEYEISLSGTASEDMYASYILSWTDPDVVVKYGGETPLTSPANIEQYSPWWGSVVIITYNGAETATIAFDLEDGYVPPDPILPMLDGAYTASVADVSYTITFVPAGEGSPIGQVTVVGTTDTSCDGTFAYTYNPSVASIAIENDGKFLIAITAQEELTFQATSMHQAVKMAQVSDTVLGENAILIDYSGDFFTFIPSESGSYEFTWATGETNGYFAIETYYGTEAIWLDEEPYEIFLEAGEIFKFFLSTSSDEVEPDEINLVITKKDISSGGDDTGSVISGDLILGDNSVMISVQGQYSAEVTKTFVAPYSGTFVLDSADGDKKADIFIETEYGLVDLPYTFELQKGGTIELVVSKSNYMVDDGSYEVCFNITGEEGEVAGDPTLSVGSNTVAVTEAWNGGIQYVFTAEETGRYSIEPGDEFAMIARENKNPANLADNPWIVLEETYTFELEAGESINFRIGHKDYKNVDVIVVITKL